MDNLSKILENFKNKKKNTSKPISSGKALKPSLNNKAGKFSNKAKVSGKGQEISENPVRSSSKVVKKNSARQPVEISFNKPIQKKREKSAERLFSRNLESKIRGKKIIKITKKQGARTTPKPAQPSPQNLLRTPESFRFLQNQSISIKKTKRPASGSCFKRFSLEDINKSLYTDAVALKLSFDTPSKPADQSYVKDNKDYSEIIQISVKENSNEEPETEERFESPKNLIKVHSSPNKISLKSPDFVRKTPRKTLFEFDSPGSFNFSISSSSSFEYCPVNKQRFDIYSQTDILDLQDN